MVINNKLYISFIVYFGVFNRKLMKKRKNNTIKLGYIIKKTTMPTTNYNFQVEVNK